MKKHRRWNPVKCPDCEYYHPAELEQADVCLADKTPIFNHRTGRLEEIVCPQTCWMRNDGYCNTFKPKELA